MSGTKWDHFSSGPSGKRRSAIDRNVCGVVADSRSTILCITAAVVVGDSEVPANQGRAGQYASEAHRAGLEPVVLTACDRSMIFSRIHRPVGPIHLHTPTCQACAGGMRVELLDSAAAEVRERTLHIAAGLDNGRRPSCGIGAVSLG